MKLLLLLFFCTFFGSIPDASAGQNGFSWPISCIPGIDCAGTHFRIGYPDVGGIGLSFACGSPGYLGHQGTDIMVSSVDQRVRALAAADGVVRWTADGRFDRCPSDSEHDCDEQEKSELLSQGEKGATLGFNAGNFAVVEHTLGTTQYLTLYAHLRKGSLAVASGQKIVRGQYIGDVASSGNSQIPHLHFGVYKAEGNRYIPTDPWKGSCNASSDGLWVTAIPYHSEDLLAVQPTHNISNDPDVYMQTIQRSTPKNYYY